MHDDDGMDEGAGWVRVKKSEGGVEILLAVMEWWEEVRRADSWRGRGTMGWIRIWKEVSGEGEGGIREERRKVGRKKKKKKRVDGVDFVVLLEFLT